ncbi:MAG: nucleoside hydrolase [Anaerolineae bacterium]|nr:nucleoside hydrolase [Anaerolineae bacterium]
MPRDFLIDTDTASDDAVALLMALRWPDVAVRAITVVSGNVPVDQGVTNALYTVELCGVDVSVYRGADRPLMREPVHAQFFHGQDGMGDQHYPPPKASPRPEHAIDTLIETIKAYPGLTLVTLGPLTNIALALARAPEIARMVGRCVVMGGAANTVGNVTPAAEYNIWADPEAARRVFHSGLPIEMVGCELSTGPANITEAEMAEIRALNTPLAHFTLDCNRAGIRANREWLGDPGLALPDPVAMAIALDPTICTRSSCHYVEVETSSPLTRGMTIVDRLGVATDERNRPIWGTLVDRPPNVTVCWAIDIPRWKAMLYSVLKEQPA